MTDENQPPVPPQQPTPPPPAAPQYQAAPPVTPPGSGYTPAPGAPVPGKTLGIVGLILAIAGFFIFPIVAPIVGLILSIIGGRQSKAAGVANGPAKAGVIVSIIALILDIIIFVIVIIVVVTAASSALEMCNQLGPGIHELDGITYTCGTSGIDY